MIRTILAVLLLAATAFGQIRLAGNISSSVPGIFTTMFSIKLYGGGAWANYDATGNCGATGAWSYSVPDGWTGSAKVSRGGFNVTPDSVKIASNHTGINFTATDTMKPSLYLRKPASNLYLGITDTIKTVRRDNSNYLKSLKYYVSYNNGSTWTTILDTTNSAGFYAQDTVSPNSKKAVAYTPNSVTAQFKVRAIATDYDNNSDTIYSPTLQVIDNVAPVVNVTTPSTLEAGLGIVNISWTQSDNSGTISRDTVKYSTNNGTTWTVLTMDGSSPYTWTIPYTLSTQCLVRVNAVDPSGNIGYGTSATFTIQDATKPTISLTSGTLSNNAVPYTITFTAADGNGGTVVDSFRVTGTQTTPYTAIAGSSLTWSPAAIGTYTVIIKTTDQAGLKDSVSTNAVTLSAVPAPTVVLNNLAPYMEGGLTTTLTWIESGSITSRLIEYRRNTGSWTAISGAVADSVSWNIPRETSPTIYDFKVTVNGPSGSMVTPIVSAYVSDQLPVITFDSIKTIGTTGTTMSASFIATDGNSNDGALPLSSVQYKVNNGSYTSLTVDPSLAYSVTWTPSSAGTYTFTYKAVDQAGNVNTVTTNSFTVKTTQTISFSSLPTKQTTDAAFSLSASASSGLPVTYVSCNTSVATVSGSTVTIVGPGQTTITASQAGNGSYYAAADVMQNLNVNSPEFTDQTITFNALSAVTYGASPITLAATASSGLTVTYTTSDATIADISGSTLTILKAGTATITASQAGNALYNPAMDVKQTLTVNKATATVALGNLRVTYDGGTKAATFSTTPTGLSVSLAYNGSATAPSAVGKYVVVATVNDVNYVGTATDTLIIQVTTKAGAQTVARDCFGLIHNGRTLKYGVNAGAFEIAVHDMAGRLVYGRSMVASAGFVETIPAHSTQMYVILLTQGTRVLTSKILIR